jgi:hypothetical protein
MPSELEIYKQNRINNFNNTFKTNLARLKDNLGNNIKIINRSSLKPKVKNQQINNLINQFNNSVRNLTNELNNNLNIINNFQPNPIAIKGSKKALLIGINYTGTNNQLNGCINDINCIKERISNNGFSDITILTDNTSIKPTKSNIINAFRNLLSSSNPGDLLFFAYSGHGSYTKDKNSDEKTGYDQLIVPLDLNMIVDDELKTIIQNTLKSGVTLFSMFDSCFSGSVLDLKYQYMDSLNYDNYTENNKQLETNGDVFMISGCSDYQTSADAFIDNKANGAMTWSLLKSLKETPNCSWRELLKTMRNLLKSSEFDQIPQFSTGQFENIDSQVFI